jgi:hypothetical protein
MNPFQTPLDPPPKARPVRFRPQTRPDLTAEQILEWCDAYRARFGRWPTRRDGTRGLPDTNWSAVDACVKNGSRGLRRGSSLAKLLLAHRGRRHKGQLPRLTTTLLLQWADAVILGTSSGSSTPHAGLLQTDECAAAWVRTTPSVVVPRWSVLQQPRRPFLSKSSSCRSFDRSPDRSRPVKKM